MADSLSALAEQLHRIEHKLDLILEGQARSSPTTTLRSVGDAEHACPICFQQVQYHSDMFAGHVVRNCGCGTGVLSPLQGNVQILTTPGDPGKGIDNG